MDTPVDRMRSAILALAHTLDPKTFALVPTSRGLEALVDHRFADKVSVHRWYAVITRGDHLYAVADIDGQRISLQRYVLKLEHPQASYEELKQVSFVNKVSFDCRLSNLVDRLGRQAVMRNRRPKRNTSSVYKGVIKSVAPDGSITWRAQIKGDEGSIALGRYDDEHWAATVYDAAAYLLFNGAALYNFPGRAPDLDALRIAAERITRHRHKRSRTAPGGLAPPDRGPLQ